MSCVYELNSRMWFNEEEKFVKSLKSNSSKKVVAICPFCFLERNIRFCDVIKCNSTYCPVCGKKESNYQSVVGKRFNRLLVIGSTESKKKEHRGNQRVLCVCDCGVVKEIEIQSLKCGDAQSCGCYHRDLSRAKVGRLNPNFGKRGAESYAYNKNLSDEQRMLAIKGRRNAEAVRFRKEVRERDGACIVCGSTKNLVVHHLNSFKNNESLRCDIGNGVTLCRGCHTDFHCNFMGSYRIPCTKEDFGEYVLQV